MVVDPEARSGKTSFEKYDQAPLFDAYAEHTPELTERLDLLLENSRPEACEIRDMSARLVLTPDEIGRIWGLIPPETRSRAVPNIPDIVSEPPHWFTGEHSRGEPMTTTDRNEGLSPTSLSLAYTSRDHDRDLGLYRSRVALREIPDDIAVPEVRRLVQAKALLHELIHTAVTNHLYLLQERPAGVHLVLPGGERTQPKDVLERFVRLAERRAPISYYSSFYREADGSFPAEGVAKELAIEEELVETITAYLLGSTVRIVEDRPTLDTQPFEDGPEIKDLIGGYLVAPTRVTR